MRVSIPFVLLQRNEGPSTSQHDVNSSQMRKYRSAPLISSALDEAEERFVWRLIVSYTLVFLI